MEDNKTTKFQIPKDPKKEARDVMNLVYDALKEKGYNPISQLVGYFLSGDPTYITSHMNARSAVRRLERDEFLEEIIKYYIGE